jgi:hypothetical protein
MNTDLNPPAWLAQVSADVLNQGSFCRTLNLEQLSLQLERDPRLGMVLPDMVRARPHLFSSTVVFLSAEVARSIREIVSAVENVSALPGYRAQALTRAPVIAQHAFGPIGACMGYDFHLSAGGPQLIEVNTNAGGILLNLALARAQQSCCKEMDWAFAPKPCADDLEQSLFDMFKAEWRYQRGDAPWGRVLIVDDEPEGQYLAPEFELFRQLFERFGVSAAVADPSALSWHDGKLWHQDASVDMVYNRLTDFYLVEPAHQALRHAYESGAVVLTPHPRAHALHADKRNLIALSQDALLSSWGASARDRKLLAAAVPRTRLVTAERADELWAERRKLFFKPVAGFGAKAAYRGDKLTRRVWAEILQGDFVAQALVPPTERLIEVDGVQTDLKFDLRAYSYAGRVQLLAARMYSGQTTNFRTQGGGFAPVIVLPPAVQENCPA